MLKKCFTLLALFALLTKVVFYTSSVATNSNTTNDQASIQQRNIKIDSQTLNYDEPVIFAGLPSFDQQIKTSIKTADARSEIIRQYLNRYESPLEPYSDLIVNLSDQYNFDYRWLIAIAQQESSLCHRIPENSYNCWGWGIYGDKVTRFDSYEDALRRIAPQFTKIFLKGSHNKDPYEVMKTYTPPSDGSWANGVSTFFDNLE